MWHGRGSTLAALPAGQRAAVVLRHWLDLDVAECARLLRVDPGTVKSQTSRGPAKLRELHAVVPMPGESPALQRAGAVATSLVTDIDGGTLTLIVVRLETGLHRSDATCAVLLAAGVEECTQDRLSDGALLLTHEGENHRDMAVLAGRSLVKLSASADFDPGTAPNAVVPPPIDEATQRDIVRW